MKKQLTLIAKLFFLSFLLSFIAFHGLFLPTSFLNKLPQIVTIFLSIVIQALPFVLIGVFGSALIQNFVTVDMVESKLNRTTKLPGILLAIGAGFCFPVCDCGVIPVVRRMLLKKVPPYMAIAFLVTAPLVNPITVWATATAFGYNPSVTLIRVGMAIFIGIIVALAVSEFFPSLEQLFTAKAIHEWEADNGEISKVEAEIAAHQEETVEHHHENSKSFIWTDIFDHANEEFLEVGKFLIIGALIASITQTILNDGYSKSSFICRCNDGISRKFIPLCRSRCICGPFVHLSFSTGQCHGIYGFWTDDRH